MGAMEVLLKFHANMNQTNSAGATVMHMLVFSEVDLAQREQQALATPIALAVLQKCAGLDLNAVDGSRDTVLHACINRDNSGACNIIVTPGHTWPLSPTCSIAGPGQSSCSCAIGFKIHLHMCMYSAVHPPSGELSQQNASIM